MMAERFGNCHLWFEDNMLNELLGGATCIEVARWLETTEGLSFRSDELGRRITKAKEQNRRWTVHPKRRV